MLDPISRNIKGKVLYIFGDHSPEQMLNCMRDAEEVIFAQQKSVFENDETAIWVYDIVDGNTGEVLAHRYECGLWELK